MGKLAKKMNLFLIKIRLGDLNYDFQIK